MPHSACKTVPGIADDSYERLWSDRPITGFALCMIGDCYYLHSTRPREACGSIPRQSSCNLTSLCFDCLFKGQPSQALYSVARKCNRIASEDQTNLFFTLSGIKWKQLDKGSA